MIEVPKKKLELYVPLWHKDETHRDTERDLEMNQLEIMNWARERLVSLPIAIVIYQATKKLSINTKAHLGAMDAMFRNPSDAEFSLITKMAFMLPEAQGLETMFWGDKEVTR